VTFWKENTYLIKAGVTTIRPKEDVNRTLECKVLEPVATVGWCSACKAHKKKHKSTQTFIDSHTSSFGQREKKRKEMQMQNA
jgi:hypothetical protein